MDYLNIFIAQWNFSIAQKRFFFKVPYTVFLSQIIIKLHLLGFFSYYEINSNSIYIFKPKPISLIQISKPGNRQYWSLKKLKKKSESNFYILSSSRHSIISSVDAIFFNFSGEILFQIIF